MTTTTQTFLNHFRSLNPAARAVSTRNGQQRRQRHLTRALWCGATIAWMACGVSRSYGSQSLSWAISGESGNGPVGTATDGATVTEAFTEHSPGNFNYAGAINAAVSWSDLSQSYDGKTDLVGLHTGSHLDLWAYNQPGQTGPITVTITPHVFIRSWHVADVEAPPWQCISAVTFAMRLNDGIDEYVKQYDASLYAGHGISVANNNMSPTTIGTSDGGKIGFNMSHQVSAQDNTYCHSDGASLAWYSVRVSPNGYLSTGPRDPANPPIPVVMDSTPQTTSVAFTDASHTQMTVSGIGGPTNVPLPYLVMTTTNVSLPLANWVACQTNNFATNGTFSYSFPVNANESQRFFQLQMAQ